MKNDLVESVCVFGSVARSSTDALSDRDVLIVANSPEKLKELSADWRSKGWSTSTYTPNRLSAIIRARSLFAQHLKHEGLIIADRGNWLKYTLEKIEKKKNYIDDARNSVDLALPIERIDSDILLKNCPFSADAAYVSVRNFGINFLADRNILEFDYKNIVGLLHNEMNFNSFEISTLYSLRRGKSAYRDFAQNWDTDGSVGDLKELLSKIFSHRRLLSVESTEPLRYLGSGYSRMRDLEASIITNLGCHPSSDDLRRLNLTKIWKYIINSSIYSWEVRNFKPHNRSFFPPSSNFKPLNARQFSKYIDNFETNR